MSVKQSKNRFSGQNISPIMRQSQRLKTGYMQIYKIKVDQIQTHGVKQLSERNVYLNIIFCDQNQNSFQSQCIDIRKDSTFFKIRTRKEIEKVEVLDYDSLKKLSKISFKGIGKEFKYTHIEKKSHIQVQIQRAHQFQSVLTKNSKMTESVTIEQDIKQRDFETTDDSASVVSN